MNAAIPIPVLADDRNARERLEDAKRALDFVHDLLCHVDQHNRGLSCLDSENLAGFLRVVLAQFPPD